MNWHIAKCLYVFPASLLLTGCGTAHIGDTTHVHVYSNMTTSNADSETSRFMRFVQHMQSMAAGDADPLKGFLWDDTYINRLEKDQNEKGNKNYEEFDQNF